MSSPPVVPLFRHDGSSPRRDGTGEGLALPPVSRTSTIARVIPDAELVARMLAGERYAKEAFYRKHVDQAYRIARRLVGSVADSEDVVQEAFSQAFSDLPQLRNPATLRAWFLRIVVNRAHRKFRTRRFLSLFGFANEDDGEAFEVASGCPADVAAELALVQSLLQSFSPGERAAWLLRRVEGCSLGEVAEACACSLATAKRRIAKVDVHVSRHVAGEEVLGS